MLNTNKTPCLLLLLQLRLWLCFSKRTDFDLTKKRNFPQTSPTFVSTFVETKYNSTCFTGTRRRGRGRTYLWRSCSLRRSAPGAAALMGWTEPSRAEYSRRNTSQAEPSLEETNPDERKGKRAASDKQVHYGNVFLFVCFF